MLSLAVVVDSLLLLLPLIMDVCVFCDAFKPPSGLGCCPF